MQAPHDDSLWKDLALAFGGGLAFGVGVNLSKNTSRTQPTTAPSLAERLNDIEQRIDRARQTNTLPQTVNHKMVEAVVSVVDARLREQTAQFEQRLAAAIDSLRNEVTGQLATAQKRSDDDDRVLRAQVTGMHRQFAGSVAQLVDQQVAAALDARVTALEQQLREEIQQQVALTAIDRQALDLVMTLGQFCLQAAERLSGPPPVEEVQAVEPVETAPPEVAEPPQEEPAPDFLPEQLASSKPLWRIPLVSSFFLVTGGLLLLHYL